MAKLSADAVHQATRELGCKVAAVTGDNAKNMCNSRAALADLDVFTFGCQAHILNLLAGDYIKEGRRHSVAQAVVAVLKAFKNSSTLGHGLKQFQVPRPPLPADTRWNSWLRSLKFHNRYWAFMSQVAATDLPAGTLVPSSFGT
jgi:hypothetical protein